MTLFLRFFILLLSLICIETFGQNQTDSIHERKIDVYSKQSKDSLFGKPFIDFEGTLLNGQKFKLSEHTGKVILLNFWFIGCPPCMGEIPDINELHRTYKDSNVVLISLSTNSIKELNRFIEGKHSRPIEKIEYPILPDCRSISEKYQITGYPTNILIDKKGIIRLVSHGASIESLKKYIAFYGDKGLSKGWKDLAQKFENVKEADVSEVFTELLNDLLKE
ncbi:MAG: alkyl hydroperoxide reductase/Thiol specific antioxidant/Mal allergen [Bacteroidetes bacterium]|jgi:peroxiredoxin|nr:alkyl hydroperoxide reductase/Thiol specific antioxidant/Mal allergen [Bacteroidota bacterium]